MTRNYIVIAVSLILSIGIFIFLLNIQENIKKEKELVEIFYAAKDINIYANVDQTCFTKMYIESSKAKELNLLTEVKNDTMFITNIRAGEVVSSDMIMEKNEKISKKDREIITININSKKNSYSNYLNKNSYINVYIKVPRKFLPNDYESLKKIEYSDSESVTFLYFNNARPITLFDKDGKKIEESGFADAISLEVSTEQSMYINSVIDASEFYISIV